MSNQIKNKNKNVLRKVFKRKFQWWLKKIRIFQWNSNDKAIGTPRNSNFTHTYEVGANISKPIWGTDGGSSM